MSRPTIAPERIAETMLELATQRGPSKTIGPMDVARALGGDHPDGWGPLMPAIRRVAVGMMKQGRVVITRKGRPVDPDDFRGVYRIALAATEPDGAGEGSSASTRPNSR
jgi:Protein of unknown function (DUF3253)